MSVDVGEEYAWRAQSECADVIVEAIENVDRERAGVVVDAGNDTGSVGRIIDGRENEGRPRQPTANRVDEKIVRLGHVSLDALE